MANRAKPGEQFGVAPKKIQDYVSTIIKEHKKLAKKKAAHARDCRPNNEVINDTYATAKSAGLDRKALKLAVNAELSRIKYEEERKAMEPEQIDMLDYIEQCIGNTDDDEPERKTPSKATSSVKAAADRAAERGNVTSLHAAS